MAIGIVAVRPGNISGEHQRRAEFAKRPREREDGSREDAGPGQRQRNFVKDAPLRGAQRPRRFEKSRIHLLERRASGEIHQRKRDHGGGDHRRGPGENYRRAQLQQESSEGPVAAEEQEQQKPHDGRRKHQRQKENPVDDGCGGPAPSFAPSRGGEADDQRDQRGRHARFEGYADGRPIHRVGQYEVERGQQRHRERIVAESVQISSHLRYANRHFAKPVAVGIIQFARPNLTASRVVTAAMCPVRASIPSPL